MEFTNYKCPVCTKVFEQGDDVVVCPECGAPHHRECYEKIGRCFFEDRHKAGFSFEEDTERAEEQLTECNNCGHENPKATFYCEECGYPLGERDQKQTQGGGKSPFEQGSPFNVQAAVTDPMAGVSPETPLADGVTAGEAARFVGKNTPYFMLVFNKIKTYKTSRFNFAAFLFSGAYLLYRKMTAIGIAITAAMLATMAVESVIILSPEYQSLYSSALGAISSGYLNASSLSTMFSRQELLFLYSPLAMTFLQGIIMLLCGFLANRWYYKLCVKRIKTVKAESSPEAPLNTRLERAGGVNTAAAILTAVLYLVMNYLPGILL